LYPFQGSNTLTLGQIVFSLIFLWALKKQGAITYPDFNKDTANSLLSLSAAFLGMVISGLAALRFVNVPMYGVLRRLTTFIVIVLQYATLGKLVSAAELLSVIVMVFGAFIGGWGDLTFDAWGYFLTTLNCLLTAIYLVWIAKKSEETKLDTFGLMFYNNILSLPFILIICVLTEWDEIVSFESWFDWGFQFYFLGSSILAFLLNYFVFLTTTINSPLTTNITGQLKSLVSTLVGLFTFGGVTVTFSLALGLSVSTFGGLWYGWVKYSEKVNQIKSQNHKFEEKQQLIEGEQKREEENEV
jgi:solute carrier family 35 protein